MARRLGEWWCAEPSALWAQKRRAPKKERVLVVRAEAMFTPPRLGFIRAECVGRLLEQRASLDERARRESLQWSRLAPDLPIPSRPFRKHRYGDYRV